jgi:hypothetical protein
MRNKKVNKILFDIKMKKVYNLKVKIREVKDEKV